MKKLILGFIAVSLTTVMAQAGSFSTTQYVQVVKSKAKYNSVVLRTPYEECWDERVPVRQNGYRSSNQNSGFGTLIGGVAGGIIGNQVGKGRGKTIATIGGALIGSLVGNNLSQRDYNNNSYSYTTYKTIRRCTTHYNEKRERKFVGYKNIGYFNGHKIVRYSPKRLKYIPVTITASY